MSRVPSLSAIEVCCALAAGLRPLTTTELSACVAAPAGDWTLDRVLGDMAVAGLVARSSTLVTRWLLTPRGAEVASLEESARRIVRSRGRSEATDRALREISREILGLIRGVSPQSPGVRYV